MDTTGNEILSTFDENEDIDVKQETNVAKEVTTTTTTSTTTTADLPEKDIEDIDNMETIKVSNKDEELLEEDAK